MCLIRATCRDATFKPFAATTRLPIVWGEEVSEDRNRAFGRQFAGKRILVCVSSRDWTDFNGQVRDAIEFLYRWRDELLRLVANYELEQFALEIPIGDRDAVGRSESTPLERLPIELILLAAQIGLRIETAECSLDRPLAH